MPFFNMLTFTLIIYKHFKQMVKDRSVHCGQDYLDANTHTTIPGLTTSPQLLSVIFKEHISVSAHKATCSFTFSSPCRLSLCPTGVSIWCHGLRRRENCGSRSSQHSGKSLCYNLHRRR